MLEFWCGWGYSFVIWALIKLGFKFTLHPLVSKIRKMYCLEKVSLYLCFSLGLSSGVFSAQVMIQNAFVRYFNSKFKNKPIGVGKCDIQENKVFPQTTQRRERPWAQCETESAEKAWDDQLQKQKIKSG